MSSCPVCCAGSIACCRADGPRRCGRRFRSSRSRSCPASATACCSSSASPLRPQRRRCRWPQIRSTAPLSRSIRATPCSARSPWASCSSASACSLRSAHLGRPARAWRAFSQWRSSWLSREGIAAVLGFVPIGAIAALLLTHPDARLTLQVLGLIIAACCVLTVFCTARIYSSLPPIRAWHNRYTLPGYLLLGLYGGGLWHFAIYAATYGKGGLFVWALVYYACNRARRRAGSGPAETCVQALPRYAASSGDRRGHRLGSPWHHARFRATAHGRKLPHARDGIRARAQARAHPARRSRSG